MEVILREDIENLGLTYDLVDVKPGYARNYLIPQGKAVLATPVEKDNLDAILSNLAKEQAAEIKEAQDKIEQLQNAKIKINSKAGASGKLFGSINNARISEELANQGIEIDKKYIKVPGNNVKRAGNYTATVRLHRDVQGDVDFEIVAEIEKTKSAKTAKKEAKEAQAKMAAEGGGDGLKKMSLDQVANMAKPKSAREKEGTETDKPGEDLNQEVASTASTDANASEE